MKVDMSPEAIWRRLHELDQITELAMALRSSRILSKDEIEREKSQNAGDGFKMPPEQISSLETRDR